MTNPSKNYRYYNEARNIIQKVLNKYDNPKIL